VQFGAIVNRSPLLVAISTDGAAPVFGQAIRARIETLLPHGLQCWAQAAKAWRPLVQARNLSFAARRRFWEKFTQKALQSPEKMPTGHECEAMIAEMDKLSSAPPQGRVTLVGAGPGAADLLTMKAIRALQAADIILYDDLVSFEVLELARREAKRILVGKTGHGPSCKQTDINTLMVSLAKQGRHVVRLKSGDPLIFGRATEEIAACRTARIPVTVVPGITTAQAAGASLCVSLTARKTARRLQFITGHADDGKLPQHIDWASVIDRTATTVLYMPRRTLAQFSAIAIAQGLDHSTPAIAMVNVSRPDEVRVFATIRDLPDRIAALPQGPMLVLMGQAMHNTEDVLEGEIMNEIKEFYSFSSSKLS
jgi:uroporphyrin-III C-methyltransferase / precorrin-2 dehydrogenase / sirohydrochlorin ferrochelatase